MPARNRPGLSENTRKRIQTTMIVKRLSDHLDGKCELSQTQVRSAEILLRKSLPDLQSVELTGKEGEPLKVIFGMPGDERL